MLGDDTDPSEEFFLGERVLHQIHHFVNPPHITLNVTQVGIAPVEGGCRNATPRGTDLGEAEGTPAVETFAILGQIQPLDIFSRQGNIDSTLTGVVDDMAPEPSGNSVRRSLS
jgi:hypothetical protein